MKMSSTILMVALTALPGLGVEATAAPRQRNKARIVAPPAESRIGLSPAILSDSTLQRGDVVTSPRGLLVFMGQPGKQHTDASFVPLQRFADWRKNKDLVEANRAVARGPAAAVTQTAAASLPEGKPLVRSAGL